jgi:hypothetical protein
VNKTGLGGESKPWALPVDYYSEEKLRVSIRHTSTSVNLWIGKFFLCLLIVSLFETSYCHDLTSPATKTSYPLAVNSFIDSGYVSQEGNVVIPFIYDAVFPFSSNGLACVRKGKAFGCIDVDGNIVIPIIYKFQIQFSENGLAPVCLNDKWGFINSKGETVIPFEYESAFPFSPIGIAAVKQDERWGYIDINNSIKLPLIYDNAFTFRDNGYADVEIDGKSMIIDTKGAVNENIKQEIAGGVNEEDLVLVRHDGNFGCVDMRGVVAIPPIYTHISPFHQGLARVYIGGKCGFIDRFNNEIIPPRFSSYGDFSPCGLAWYRDSEHEGYINKKGENVFQINFDLVEDFSSDGIANVRIKNRDGIIDCSGEWVLYTDHEINRGSEKFSVFNRNNEVVLCWDKQEYKRRLFSIE